MKSNNIQHRTNDISRGQAALIAATVLLLMAILAPIANFTIVQNLIVPDDPGKTFSNVVASQDSFRLGILGFMIVVILDIIAAWALYVFLRPVHKSISLLTAWFRLVYAAMLGVVSIFLINVLQLAGGAPHLSAFEPSQLHSQVLISFERFNLGWEFALIVFGFHLFGLGYLLIKAGYMRTILGILVILASLGYIIDGVGKLVSSNYNITVSVFTFVGEVILIFWLFIKGRMIQGEN